MSSKETVLSYTEWRKYVTNSISLRKWNREAIMHRLNLIKFDKKMKHRITEEPYSEYLIQFLNEIEKTFPKKMADNQFTSETMRKSTEPFRTPITTTTTSADVYKKSDKVFRKLGDQNIKPSEEVNDGYFSASMLSSLALPILSLGLGILVTHLVFSFVKNIINYDTFSKKLSGIAEHVKSLKETTKNLSDSQ